MVLKFIKEGGIEAMEYSVFAFREGLHFLVHMDAKTNFEKSDFYNIRTYQGQKNWDGVGDWKFKQ